MAFIAHVAILVDDANEDHVYDGINELLRRSDSARNDAWLCDWSFKSVDRVNDAINDSIANDTYDEGDAFRDWVIYSHSEALSNNGDGFWSNAYGWTTLNLATKYECQAAQDLPSSTGGDAAWILAPHSMSFYRVMLVESPNDQLLDQTPIAFECWAENDDQAIAQTERAYPGCRVLGMG